MTATSTATAAAARESHPRHRWVPAIAALAGLALTVKAGLIIGTGNAVADRPMTILYLVGLALGLTATIGFGLRRTTVVLRITCVIGASLLLVVWIVALGELVEPLFGAVKDAQYVRDEGPVGLLGLVLLATAYAGYSHDHRS